MTDSTTKAPTTLRLLVPDEEEAAPPTTRTAPGAAPSPVPGEFREEGLFGWVRKKVLKAEDISITAAEAELARIDAEVNTLLTSMSAASIGGFQLKEVQVGIIISGQGNFGIVTAGLQASLTLVYDKA